MQEGPVLAKQVKAGAVKILSFTDDNATRDQMIKDVV